MPDSRRGTRRQRLAALLADLVPQARTVRISPSTPHRSGPSGSARAYDVRGRPLPLTCAVRSAAARWVMRTYPEVDWSEPHDLDPATGTLRATARTYGTARGR